MVELEARYHLPLRRGGGAFHRVEQPDKRQLLLRPIAPPVSFPFTLPISNLGTIGFLTTLTTADGIICSDFETIDTGP